MLWRKWLRKYKLVLFFPNWQNSLFLFNPFSNSIAHLWHSVLLNSREFLPSAFVPKFDPTDESSANSLVINVQIHSWKTTCFCVACGYNTHRHISNCHKCLQGNTLQFHGCLFCSGAKAWPQVYGLGWGSGASALCKALCCGPGLFR